MFPQNAAMDKQVLTTERKNSSPCTSPRLATHSEFCRTIQFSNCLVVCHCHDFSPKQLPSSKPFLIYLFFLYDSFIMSETNYVILWGCIFILINNRIIGNLGAAMQLGSKTQLSGLRKQAKPS